MAWQNIYIPNITTELSSANLETNDSVELGNTYDIVSLNDFLSINSEEVIYSKNGFKITIYTTTTQGATYEPYNPTYKVYFNDVLLASQGGFDSDIVGLALGFDYSSKKAKLRAVQRRYSSYPPTTSSTRHTISATSWSDSVQQAMYDALVNAGLITISGGAGSGYIGNSLLSNKKMVGYNVPTSDVERYKTETTNDFSAIAQANKPKMGNGYVRIKFLWDEGDDDMHTYSESEHRVGTWTNGKPVYERVVTVNEFAGTNNTWINTGVNIPNGEEIVFVGFAQAHALSDGFLFNCFAKFNENKNVLAYFATGTYTYYYSRCFIQYTKTTD